VRGSLAAKFGDPERGLDPLRRGLAEMQESNSLQSYPFLRPSSKAALSAIGRVDDGLAEIDGAIRFAKQTDHCWFVPELLRVKGEVLRQQGLHNQALAEDCFRSATRLARTQGAVFWELRAALSAARLWISQNKRADAAQILQPVYDLFTDGFERPDLQAAKAILNSLSEPQPISVELHAS
jgi:predicted ATPase